MIPRDGTGGCTQLPTLDMQHPGKCNTLKSESGLVGLYKSGGNLTPKTHPKPTLPEFRQNFSVPILYNAIVERRIGSGIIPESVPK